MQTIYIWPDGDWCWKDEIDGYGFKSDDYLVREVPDHFDSFDVENYVEAINRGGCPTCGE